MSELKLPVKFDEDFDLVDADGYPLLWCTDMIDHNPDIGIEIAMRVNNHERLVELLDKALGCMLVGIDNFSIEDREVYEDGRTLLAALEAEEGAAITSNIDMKSYS